jgi:hypothetical protein
MAFVADIMAVRAVYVSGLIFSAVSTGYRDSCGQIGKLFAAYHTIFGLFSIHVRLLDILIFEDF